MAISIPNHQLACHDMFLKFFKLWKITFGFNWIWATWLNEFITSTKPYGGSMSMWGSSDKGWFQLSKRHRIFGSKTKGKELAFAQKPNHFNSILGFRTSWANIFHSRSGPSEWDPCPIHLRHPNTYKMSSHAYIWEEWSEISFVHLDGLSWPS
jgi:hypothetical protein